MSTTKQTTTLVVGTAENRVIETSLINKEEVFKMCALAEATRLPLLLIGPPGTGKTNVVLDYAKAWLAKDHAITEQDFMNKLFILETDEGTKSSEVKGLPDLEVLFTENKYTINAPISEAEVIIINEVDKASSNLRNSLLGVMNERFLFNGKHKIPCKWKLLIATCNEIPREEINSPFWDRFMLKMTVSRVAARDLVDYFDAGDKDYTETFTIPVPTKEEYQKVKVSTTKLGKMVDKTYNKLSDRTITFIPRLTKATSLIWNMSVDKALCKVAGIMVDPAASVALQEALYSPEVKAIMNKIERLKTLNTSDQLQEALSDMEGMIGGYASKGRISPEEVGELEMSIKEVLDNHPVKERGNVVDELLGELIKESTDVAGDPVTMLS